MDNTKEEADPLNDIIDYLVRCAKISFKNAHVNETEVRTSDKVKMAYDLYVKSPTEFLLQFGKYLTPNHMQYFGGILHHCNDHNFKNCIKQLQRYHSVESTRKRVRNRRFNALQKLKTESDYFSEKQMMTRNPLLYEQLVGQYLTDDEIKERDGVDRDNLTFLNLILETVDRNQLREMKNEQMLAEELEIVSLGVSETKEFVETKPRHKQWGEMADNDKSKKWGDFDVTDTRPSFKPEVRQQSTISAPERRLLREEFLQEMYCSFIEGRDIETDYASIDNDEQYDDLHQLSQDAEDKYFDSETNDIENLEEHMKLVQEYGRKEAVDNPVEDPLDLFMSCISKKINKI